MRHRESTLASLVAVTVAVGALLAPASAAAHAQWLNPAPRADENIKVGPCGAPPGPATHTFAPGETINVQFSEFVDHPGHYRIAFSPNGTSGFDDNILLDDIPDADGPREYAMSVTLPDTPCDACTLQLIQVMTESNPPSLYYSCADIVILAVAGPDADPGQPDAGAAPAGTSDAGADVPGADADILPGGEPRLPEAGPPPGYCALGGRGLPRLGALAQGLGLLLGLGLLRRRRSRRVHTSIG